MREQKGLKTNQMKINVYFFYDLYLSSEVGKSKILNLNLSKIPFVLSYLFIG